MKAKGSYRVEKRLKGCRWSVSPRQHPPRVRYGLHTRDPTTLKKAPDAIPDRLSR
ncbi:hypothetical protein RUM44_002154 [Polyplax serrata]|uniref:Uncharacterized protein n=1 Tax=Polyplax serrata TaxID=468196 RepID=A0ABR1AM27_POLSC